MLNKSFHTHAFAAMLALFFAFTLCTAQTADNQQPTPNTPVVEEVAPQTPQMMPSKPSAQGKTIEPPRIPPRDSSNARRRVMPDLISAGEAKLENGVAIINFPEEFTKQIPAGAKVTVIITPIDDCNGIMVLRADSKSFSAKELQAGKSGAKFNWLAIAKNRL